MAADGKSILIYGGALLCSLIFCCIAQHHTVSSVSKKMLFAGLISLPLSIVAGLRFGVGTDYFSYYTLFSNLDFVSFADCLAESETLFYLIVKSLKYLGFNTFWIFGIIEFLSLFFLSYALIECKDRLSIGFSFFLSFLFFYQFSLNGIRQAVAINLILFSVVKMLNYHWKSSVLAFIAASLFHSSALVAILFFAVFIFEHKRDNSIVSLKKPWWIMSVPQLMFYLFIFISPFLFVPLVKATMQLPIFEKYQGYVYDASNIYFGTSWITDSILLFIPIFIIFWRNIRTNQNIRILSELSLLHIPFLYIRYIGEWTHRLTMYTKALFILYIPMLSYASKKKNNKVIVVSYFLILYLLEYFIDYILRNSSETFPYISIFTIF